jgi:hypothetical protein
VANPFRICSVLKGLYERVWQLPGIRMSDVRRVVRNEPHSMARLAAFSALGPVNTRDYVRLPVITFNLQMLCDVKEAPRLGFSLLEPIRTNPASNTLR